MIVLLSPAKTLDFTTPWKVKQTTRPVYLDKAKRLAQILRKFSAKEIAKLMSVNAKIAQLNVDRYRSFSVPFTEKNAKPALLAYKGDVYRGIVTSQYDAKDLMFAQKTLRIISGLYGALRPLDLIQPYRLEMQISISGPQWKDLYEYWSEDVTELINKDASSDAKVIVNLASKEYFNVLKLKDLTAPVLTIYFKQNKGGAIKMVPILAKRARGLMAHHIVSHHISQPDAMKTFKREGYRFTPKLSSKSEWTFVRNN